MINNSQLLNHIGAPAHQYGAQYFTREWFALPYAAENGMHIDGMIIAFTFFTVGVKLIIPHFYIKPGGHDVSRKGIRAD